MGSAEGLHQFYCVIHRHYEQIDKGNEKENICCHCAKDKGKSKTDKHKCGSAEKDFVGHFEGKEFDFLFAKGKLAVTFFGVNGQEQQRGVDGHYADNYQNAYIGQGSGKQLGQNIKSKCAYNTVY